MKLKLIHPLLVTALLVNVLFVSACTPKQQNAEKNTAEAVDASDELKNKIETKSLKTFPATEFDAQDIRLLTAYENDFNSMSSNLEDELKLLADEGQLSESMKSERKRDMIKSSLNMLKELDLKTEQGRYIQGLYYQYWENQSKVYEELQQSGASELKNPTDAVEGMGDYYTAQAQLAHWRTQAQK